MLKDADPGTFNGIYIVCGFTYLRYGIDSLAAIIERRYHMELFRPVIKIYKNYYFFRFTL